MRLQEWTIGELCSSRGKSSTVHLYRDKWLLWIAYIMHKPWSKSTPLAKRGCSQVHRDIKKQLISFFFSILSLNCDSFSCLREFGRSKGRGLYREATTSLAGDAHVETSRFLSRSPWSDSKSMKRSHGNYYGCTDLAINLTADKLSWNWYTPIVSANWPKATE